MLTLNEGEKKKNGIGSAIKIKHFESKERQSIEQFCIWMALPYWTHSRPAHQIHIIISCSLHSNQLSFANLCSLLHNSKHIFAHENKSIPTNVHPCSSVSIPTNAECHLSSHFISSLFNQYFRSLLFNPDTEHSEYVVQYAPLSLPRRSK